MAVTLAEPEASVVAVGELKTALVPVCEGALNCTAAPETGLLKESVTITAKGEMNAVLTVVLCPAPELIAIEAAGPGLLVNEKLAAVAAPGTVAAMTYAPALLLAVGAPVVARPRTSVLTVTGVVKVAPGPLPLGIINVTGAPKTGLPPASLTEARRTFPNRVPTAVAWPLPSLTVMLAACPAVLVREKGAVVPTPKIVALTV